MARTPIDWEQRWKDIQAENRKLAKRANQRLVRLERAAQKKGMKSILQYAYKTAMKDIKSTGKQGKQRFRETIKLVDILDEAGVPLKGAALFRANVMRQMNTQKMMKEFLGSASSTIGQGLEDAARGINRTIGIERIWDKVNKTINDRFLSEYDLRLSDNDMKRFWESKKQAKLEKEVGSAQMFAVAAVMKKYNLAANKRSYEKFLRDHIDLTGIDPADYKAQKGEKFNDYLSRVQKFAEYTDDEVLNSAINKALRSGIGVKNIFL